MTIDPVTRPVHHRPSYKPQTARLRSVDDAPKFTVGQYRRMFGWDVDDGGALALGRGIVGVAIPSILAGTTAMYLRKHESCGPILALGEKGDLWVFLADPNEMVLSQDELPAGVMVLNCPHKIPLPTPGNHVTRWIRPPSMHSRWLPTLSTVLAATEARNREPAATR